ncbi:MAG: helix-turn-helix domain-containing protein [Acetatifactor sp.]|nr:helix-turn-helix domain-containing protein [Acetatifactor sp.]
MTFGEKLREARKNAGLSQEQFAEMLCVSRAAVAKWETDRGMPDVNNLKTMAQLLNVSVDYLLDDGEKLVLSETRKPIDLSAYEKSGKCRSKQDAACLAHYQDADAIHALIRRKKQTTAEKVVDFVVRPGIIQVADYFNDATAYYLAEKGGKQYLVNITKDFIISNELGAKVESKRFVLGNNKYVSAYRIL